MIEINFYWIYYYNIDYAFEFSENYKSQKNKYDSFIEKDKSHDYLNNVINIIQIVEKFYSDM